MSNQNQAEQNHHPWETQEIEGSKFSYKNKENPLLNNDLIQKEDEEPKNIPMVKEVKATFLEKI